MNIEFNKNEDVNKQLVYELKTKLKKIYQGGGEKNAAKQKEKGKLLAKPANLQIVYFFIITFFFSLFLLFSTKNLDLKSSVPILRTSLMPLENLIWYEFDIKGGIYEHLK